MNKPTKAELEVRVEELERESGYTETYEVKPYLDGWYIELVSVTPRPQ